MQRVLRRNLLARNQALKRQRRASKEALNDEARKIRQEKIVLARSTRSAIKAERINRREDWMLGPLAPNRLAGKDAGGYGMMDFQSLRPPNILKSEREEFFNFAVDDRVVVVTGREKGKIGKVREIDEERQAVVLADVNMVDVIVPPLMREQANSEVPYRAFPQPIPVRDVRLVVPLRDDTTGEIKDTVVKHLRGGEPLSEPAYGSNMPKHTRYIAGLDIIVPWPESEMIDRKAETADTLRIDVDDVTFSSSLHYVPMPVSLIDELRNKYSKTRLTHTQEYVQQKMKEGAEDQWKSRRRMLLPQQEYWELQTKQKEGQGKRRVTKKTLELIRDELAGSPGKKAFGPAL